MQQMEEVKAAAEEKARVIEELKALRSKWTKVL